MQIEGGRTDERAAFARPDWPYGGKFTPPELPATHVARPRLDALLDAYSAAPLTLISAPAGAGKSVMLAGWARRNPQSSAWVTLDEGDNDPKTFWSSMREAIFTPDDRPKESVVEMFRELEPGPTRKIVLDDGHALTSPDAQRSLAQLVDQLPASVRLVVASRTQPDLPLHRLRITGVAAEIAHRELRFTIGEATELFVNAGRPADDLATLVTRTDGWATGLALAATMRGSADDIDADVHEFLRQEILLRQPDSTQQFLAESACLEYLDAALCAHITGRHDAADVLRQLEHENAFVSAVEHEHGRYVIHRQFRTMLHEHLHSNDPARVLAIHREAARWYEERDDVAAAMQQWLESDAAYEALTLLRRADARFGDTRPDLIGGWIGRIDTASARGEVPLLLDLATSCSLARDDERLADVLARVDEVLRTAPDALLQLRSQMLHARLAIGRGDVESSVAMLEAAQSTLRRDPRFARAELLDAQPRGRRLDPWLALGYAWVGRLDEARETLHNRPFTAFEDRFDQLFVWGVEATIAFAEGRLDDALAYAVRSSHAAEELDIDEYLVWPAWQVMAAVMRERDQRLEARAILDELALRAAEPLGNVFSIAAEIELAALGRTGGEESAALERLGRLRRDTAETAGTAVRQWVDQATMVTLLRLGHIHGARAVLGEYPHPQAQALIAALVELADGQVSCALGQANVIRSDSPRGELAVAMVRARAALLQEDAVAAQADASEAFRIAQRHNFVRTVLDFGSELIPLFEVAASGAQDADYLAHLRRAVGPSPLLDHHARRSGSVELSARELEVLTYLPTQLTTREIAGALHVSLNTVKSHLRHIYAKLDVDSRAAAIERARVLQLLG